MIKLQQKDIDRFWAKVAICGPDDCWEWLATFTNDGYGRFWLNGKHQSAHRVAYVLEKAEQLDNLLVCHSCDNPKCCNPSHLFLGTVADNMHDRDNKGRQIALCGEKQWKHILTEKQVREIKTILKNYHWGMCTDLAKQYGVARVTISKIKTGRLWRHVNA